MTLASFAQPDSELISDFFNDFQEAYHASEHLLLQLERQPNSEKLLNDLFRRIHTIKGNLIYIGLADICPLLQSVEDILEPLRKGLLIYDDLLSDVILLAMDTTYELVNARLRKEPAPLGPEAFQQICDQISQVGLASEAQRPATIGAAIGALDPDATPVQIRSLESRFGIEPNNDLRFFAQLLPAIDQRSPYWTGRTERIAEIALNMNLAANSPVEPAQLLAAVYMHDFAMAFLPLDLLHKPGSYTNTERQRVQAHAKSAASLLRGMGNWESAADIVLQHHEQANGEGYPQQLKEAEICDGAKILAIVDTFDACLNSRAHVDQPQRPLIRAILEINRFAGSQFSQAWVDIFNQVARPKRNATERDYGPN